MGKVGVQLIYDAFSFFGGGAELDLLELRLNELDKVVDKFVIVEATLTHSGLPKRLYYAENVGKFYDFHDKIIYVIVDDMPVTREQLSASYELWDRYWIPDGYLMGDNWIRERYQRNQMMSGLIQCKPDDIIIIGDADEIVRPSILEHIYETIVDGSNCIMQTMITGYMNFKGSNYDWAGSKIMKYKFVTNPSEHRFHMPASNVILDAGWHMNYLGGAEAIRTKIKSYAHQEYNNANILNGVESRLANKKDVLGRIGEIDCQIIPIDERMPKYILENPEKFDKYMYRGG